MTLPGLDWGTGIGEDQKGLFLRVGEQNFIAGLIVRILEWINIFYLNQLMSQSKLIDGKTGELIGGNYYTTGANYVTTTTSNYVPATTTYAYGTGSGAGNAQNLAYTQGGNVYGGNYAEQYTTSSYPAEYTSGREYVVRGGAVPASSTQVVTTTTVPVATTVNTGKEVIKGESRIEYVPFEKKIVEYKDQAKVERVPKKVKKIEYREERKIETIPKEVTVTDYYAVEYLRQYIPQYVPEKRIEYVQVPKKQVRYEYIPVERQIVHYPDQPLEVEKTNASQAVYAQQGATTTYVTGSQAVQGAQYVSGQTGQYVTGQATQYVTGQAGQYVSGQAGQYVTVPGGQYVSTTAKEVVQGGQQYVTGGSQYGANGQTYTTTYVNPATTTTTYEYVNAPSTTYVEKAVSGGQRWDPNSYASYPEGTYTQK